jgi:hypothetical protein
MATAVCVEPDSKKQESSAAKPAAPGQAAVANVPGAPAGLPLFLREPASPARTASRESPATPKQAPASDKKAAAPPAKAKAAPPGRGESGASAGTAQPVAAGDIARAPATPEQDPAFQQTANLVRGEATRQKKHDPETQKRQEAEDASALTDDDQVIQSAKEQNTGEMEKVGAKQQNEGQKFSAKKFKDDLKALISAARPETESEAKALAKEPPVKDFEDNFSKNIADEQAVVTGPLDRQAIPEPRNGMVEKTQKDLPPLAPPPSPHPIDPRLASPKARTDQEVSVQHHGDRLDAAMQDNQLSDDQLAESREPSFIQTLKVKQEATQKVAEAPAVYRQKEAALLQGAEAQTDGSLAAGLGRMGQVNQRTGTQVRGGQTATETRTEQRQREIKKSIDDIYKATVDGVKCVLEEMARSVKEAFTASLKAETQIFNDNVRRRISDYYGDWRIDDKIFGPADVVVEPNGETRAMTFEEAFGRKPVKRINPDVYRIFVQEKDRFVDAMDAKLDDIADNVQAGLNQAHLLIQLGKVNIAIFKSTLKGDELTYATQLEEEVTLKFETLEGSIDDTRADLLQTLADQYTENVAQLETTFNEINDELKKSWIDRAIEFIETVGRTIFQLADLLFTILVRVAHLVWDIIKHPIRFFETLVSGLMQGIGEFIGNIGTYLQEAFWTWVTGASPVQNIRLSVASGLESLFDLVMQVLRLGPADLRLIVEKVMGREFMEVIDRAMAAGEKLIEPVTILLTQGPVAFWHYLQETLASIIQSSFDRIKESVFFAFVEKALKWVAGFFIPGGGFVKIVKAIFKAFQFVAENLERIRHFFDSVFDSMEAATQGNTAGVVSKIITGLKMGIVLALDFLAKQIGLDKIVDNVQKVFQSLRRPIVSGIEWVLRKVKPFVMKIMRKLGLAKGEPRADGAYDGQIGKVVAFSAAGESHKLWIVQKGADAAVMMSSEPTSVSDQLTKYQQLADALTDMAQQEKVVGLIGQARQTLGRLDNKADVLAKDISKPKQDPQQIERQDQVVENDEEVLARQLAQIREGLGLEAEAASDDQSAQVRNLAFEALATELRVEHTAADTLAIVESVASRLRPQGLRRLEMVPGSTEEDAVVLAEASRPLPLAQFRRRADTPTGRTVTAAIKLTLAKNVTVPLGTFASAGGGPRQPTGGEILSTGSEIEAMTWNTSNIEAVSNYSDAEHQFVNWLENRRHLMALIREIEINVFNFIPCSGCASELALLLREIKRVQDRDIKERIERREAEPGEKRKLTSANLYWSKFYAVKARPISWGHLTEMKESGWTLHAPLDAYPPEQHSTKGGLTLVASGFWRLTGDSLAPPPKMSSRLGPGERQLKSGVIVRSGRSK